MLRSLALTVSLVAVTAWADAPPVSVGPDLRDLGSARSFAMGGAYEAVGYGAEVVGGNPAALSLFKRYQIEASGAWDIPNGYGFGGVQLADSASSWLAMGLSYNFITFGGEQRRWAHVTTVGLGTELAPWLHLGMAVRHHVILGATNTNSVTMNAGVIVKPLDWLSLGFSGHNLIYNYNPDISRYFVASASMMFFGQLTPAFDLRMDFNAPTARLAYHGGIEWLISMTFPLRAGYEYDGIGGHQYVSGGIGYFSEGSGIDFSYRHELGGDNGRALALTVKIQLGQ